MVLTLRHASAVRVSLQAMSATTVSGLPRLYVPQAFAEYVKAWVACKLIAKEYNLGDPDAFVFNMSVGYDLEGNQVPEG